MILQDNSKLFSKVFAACKYSSYAGGFHFQLVLKVSDFPYNQKQQSTLKPSLQQCTLRVKGRDFEARLP